MSQLAYTTTKGSSAGQFTDVIDLYLTSSNQTMGALDELLEADVEMPMAHLFRAYLLKLASDPRFTKPAQMSLAAAEALPANRREAMHLEAARMWFSGDTVRAVAVLDELLLEFPKDVLAARIAHHLHFYSGDALAMRKSIEQVANQFSEGDRHYSYVLGMHSFGCEEAGEYEKAEWLGRQAVELDSNDQWAVHAVAHVLQMQNRFAEGVEWLTGRAGSWFESNNFVYHIHWHQALFEIGREQPEAALEIYDKHLIAPLEDDFYLDVCNAASLLWRLEMLGLDVGDRWQQLVPFQRRTADTELIFCTLHYLLAPARLGDKAAIADALAYLDQWRDEDSTQGEIVTQVGAPLARAICELAEGNYRQAANDLAALKLDLYKIGGSHAQRALFTDMQVFAEQRAAA